MPKKTLGQAQPETSVAPMHKYLEADGIERQLQLNGRKKANAAMGRKQRESGQQTESKR